MARIYWETVKKWFIGTGLVATTSIVMLFAYLSMTGAITITEQSMDYFCEGTVESPCYAYINFTVNEDIFIYPTNYDPWGRNTPIEFSPGVESWRLQRSWGSGWRTIDLNKTWSVSTKYAVKFNEGQDYQVRIEVILNDEWENIKWNFG